MQENRDDLIDDLILDSLKVDVKVDRALNDKLKRQMRTMETSKENNLILWLPLIASVPFYILFLFFTSVIKIDNLIFSYILMFAKMTLISSLIFNIGLTLYGVKKLNLKEGVNI